MEDTETVKAADLRRADVALDIELAAQPVDDDIQVQLAHALDDLQGFV